MSKQLIHQYYNYSHALKRAGVSNEMAIRQPFDSLLNQMAASRHYVYAQEITIKGENGKNIRPDGTLMNELRIHKGYTESKDTGDTLDEEINNKLYKSGYPKTNILFQDSITAVLIQNGIEVSRIAMQDADKLERIVLQFINYKPEYVEKFEEALVKFKEDIPTIVETLRETIGREFEANKSFSAASHEFFEMCQKEINPQITKEDIREMIIQHILTEDLFKSVFDESDFHQENNIASQLENLVSTFMTRAVRQNQLGELGHYYKTLNAQAALVSDHHEKQKFLKVVYENFYKVYNPKGADKLGVVYTPNEIVRFMVRSTDYLLQKHFNKSLSDKNVHILDPATGTGTFITDIIDFIPAQYLEHKYSNEIFANEVAILPYYVANLNIEYTYKQKMGTYLEFPNSCFVDTLDNIDGLAYEGKQHNMFGFSSENAERIHRQNEQKISVIIGNPPYNANQANFNDFNKNREYRDIDDRIKKTYVKQSTAQKTKVYDMYARFYRWATDRLDDKGILSFVTNRSFIDSRTFDGFRKVIASEFSEIYIIDLGGDVRINPKLSGTKNNVFGIQTGIAIMILVRNNNTIIARDEKEFEALKKIYNSLKEPVIIYGDQKYFIPHCRISYYRRPEEELASDKLLFLTESHIQDLVFEQIIPDKNNNWINLSYENDWTSLLAVVEKDIKFSKRADGALFKLTSLGVVTSRDEWVIDIDPKNLQEKVKYLINEYNLGIDSGLIREGFKFSRQLKKDFDKKIKYRFDKSKIKRHLSRPFSKKYIYFAKELNEMQSKLNTTSSFDNRTIFFSAINSNVFSVFATNLLFEYKSAGTATGGTESISFYRYEDDKRVDNLSDWGLWQFTSRYQNDSITKEDIFHYTYAVLHNPGYRKKYELNLKREFPRLPFYDDFFKWASWGKSLMDLHIDYENAAPYPLQVVNNVIVKDNNYKLKVKLKADKKEGIIYIDEHCLLVGIPEAAWQYKLGNRSALEWVLDQYKEKKYADKTLAENFDTYKFSDYKGHVIELLKKVTTVSVETVKIVTAMMSESN